MVVRLEWSMSSAIKLEICTASVEDCVQAERGGADRVELNCALMLGGLTPSLAALREACAPVRLLIIARIRPQPAGCRVHLQSGRPDAGRARRSIARAYC